MNKESLIELRNAIGEYIEKSETMDKIDKVELCLNVSLFLNNYEENIKILKKHQKKL